LPEQERVLRSDPSFSRLPATEQQRLLNQLHQVNQLPEAERERRLARNEAIERLSPQERMQANMAIRRWSAMPADRQSVMRRAFNDLRSVPPDQRATVLNSARYGLSPIRRRGRRFVPFRCRFSTTKVLILFFEKAETRGMRPSGR
jgi:thioesterase domain-containing protein